MSSTTDAEEEGHMLMSNFLQAVKACQIRFGGRTELATEEDACIRNLCHILENILDHGLVVHIKKRGAKTMQHMKTLVNSTWNFQTVTGNVEGDSTAVWWFIRELLSHHEYHRFLLLKNVVTDVGRARAWIRSLLNEHSLERYINIILSEEELLSMWFEPWALLRNQEKVSMLPNVAAGLDTILFAINIDNEALNDGPARSNRILKKDADDNAETLCVAALATSSPPGSPEFASRQDYKKRRKKAASQIVSFNKNSPPRVDAHPHHINNSSAGSSSTVAAKTDICKNSPTLISADGMVNVQKNLEGQQHEVSYDQVLEALVSNSTSDQSFLKPTEDDGNSISSSCQDTTILKEVESLKPISGSAFGLIPLSPDGQVNNFYIPADSISLKSYQDDNEIVGDIKSSKIVSVGTNAASGCCSPSFSSFTMEELRTAVLEISRSRDVAETKRSEIADLFSKEMESMNILKAQMSQDQTTNLVSIDHLTSKVKSLTRENELLRHQLKKYVSAVQMLRRDDLNSGDSTEEKALSKRGPDLRDYHDEAVAYESKLIQVAEMHGELMEFNERLQKLLRLRESQVHQLREELVELRGPFPDQPTDEVIDDAISIRSDLDAAPSVRTLINIWIPTAFLAGPPVDTHHVYQIYIRIKEDEWNVYRRFAQFYDLHNTWKKKFSVVKTFDFPKKKTFGYKDISVVEARRIRLQEYLRKLINLLLKEFPQMATDPSKVSLTEKLPFLLDAPSSRVVSPQQSRVQLFSRFSSSRSDQAPPPSPHYNGL